MRLEIIGYLKNLVNDTDKRTKNYANRVLQYQAYNESMINMNKYQK